MKKRYTSDCIILKEEQDTLFVYLIERKNKPHGFAIAGGFRDLIEGYEHLQGSAPVPPAMDNDEYLEDPLIAAIREAKEETSINVKELILLGFYDDINRDPRGYTVSHVYYGYTTDTPKAADDAKSIVKVEFNKLKEFIENNDIAFDHKLILNDFIDKFKPKLKNKVKNKKRP